MCHTSDTNHSETWKQLVEIHTRAKGMLLKAEEIDPNRTFFVASMVQQRDALDHIIRAASVEHGVVTKEDDEQYIHFHTGKALSHLYRAFFDVADWLSILYRTQIAEAVKLYTTDAVRTALPEYYSKIRPRVTKICGNIAAVRTRKDIGNDATELIEDVYTYTNLVAELADFSEEVQNAVPAMDEHQSQTRREKAKHIVTKLVIAAIISAVSVWLTLLFRGSSGCR